MSSQKEIIAIGNYNNQRMASCQDKPICLAPFNNLYFKSIGDVAPCWKYQGENQKYPEQTILQIWTSEEFFKAREALSKKEFPVGCLECSKSIINGDHKNFLGSHYDFDYFIDGFPKIMEFELSNTCNLECIMCQGNLSSNIRKNREKKEPLPDVYDLKFVEQLEPFITHLKEARFNGGEPFLIDIYYSIWDIMIKKNPLIKLEVATNGTVLTERVKDVMQRGRFNINLSLDSLEENNYEMIRKNASFEDTMRNMQWFLEYSRNKDSHFLIVINPMTINWHEMPNFVDFANEIDVPIAYNTVVKPEELSLWSLPREKLKEVYEALKKREFSKPGKASKYQKYNIATYWHLVDVQIYHALLPQE